MSSIMDILKRKTRKLITSLYDPLVTRNIGNQTIRIPLSHPLPEIMKVYPQINYNLPRLVKHVCARESNVRVIDIGANVGDTVAFIKNLADVPILCIDGDKKYFDILTQNIAKYNNVVAVRTLVGAETKEINLEVQAKKGTGHVVESRTPQKITTIEDICQAYPDFYASRFLKIDTDGFDFIILRGSRNYITETKPILFFEFDPFFITKNNGNPFDVMPFLEDAGYKYLIFYMSNGDYLLACSVADRGLINQLVHYFSGRNVELYADIVAFAEKDYDIFKTFCDEEIAFFKKVRNY